MQTVHDAIHCHHQHALLFMYELVYSALLLTLNKKKANSGTRRNTFSNRNTHHYYVRRRSKTVNKACIIILLLTANFFPCCLSLTQRALLIGWKEGFQVLFTRKQRWESPNIGDYYTTTETQVSHTMRDTREKQNSFLFQSIYGRT